MIDHTLLKPWVVESEIVKICGEARAFRFAAACVNSSWVHVAARELEGSGVSICATIGFPLGACSTAAKAAEAAEAVGSGAAELDMVMNIGLLKGGDCAGVVRDIAAVNDAARARARGLGRDVILKVIIEACYLTDEEKVEACRLAVEGGAEFVKTSTGFGPSGATVEDVRLMSRAVGGRALVKAAGGIQTLAEAKAMIEAGASRIGTSRGPLLVDEMSRQA
ncbi:MAG: deoxyribose-phosphate aldolase [Firmicutes bacterium]|nr:deoxyribose-phosphate aldolase [Bacillota bacterium]